jgi:hypothetical protein
MNHFGGTDDPQAANSGRVRSKPATLPEYNPPMSIAWKSLTPGAKETWQRLQKEAASIGITGPDYGKWAQGQLETWKATASMRESAGAIPLERWLQLNFSQDFYREATHRRSEFLGQMDKDRAKKARAAMEEADARQQSRTPSAKRETPWEDLPEDTPSPYFDSGKVAARFRAEHRGSPAVELWARRQLIAFKEYLSAFGRAGRLTEPMTAQQWLTTNWRQEQIMKKNGGMIR